MIDFEKLNEGLNNLRGYEFELAETQERAAGNTFADLSFTKGFQARLAAMALKIPVDEIKALPLKEFVKVCGAVFNFLFVPSDSATPSTNSEVSSST